MSSSTEDNDGIHDMTKATHNGTCQACGRTQAVKANGRLAKHGYTVDWGYFSGTCTGSDKAPLEHATDHNEEIVARLMAHGKKLAAATVENTTQIPVNEYTGKRVNGRREKLVHWVGSQEELDALRADKQIDEHTFDVSRDYYVRRLHRESEQALNAAATLISLRDERHGEELLPRETPAQTKERKAAEKAAKGPTKAEIKRQCESLQREFDEIRNTRRDWFLNNRDADGNVLEGYWEMPHSLAHYRHAKHAGFFADLADAVQELFEARIEVRAQLQK